MSKYLVTKEKLFEKFEEICRHYNGLNKTGENGSKDESVLNYVIDVAKGVSCKRTGQPDEIFELAKTDIYPERISDLAESFGMMIVKIEARELRLFKTIEKLKESNLAIQQEMHKRTTLEETKNKELISKVIVMVERRERVLSAIDCLQKYKSSSHNDYEKQVYHVLNIIRQQFETSSEWDEFESYFLDVYKNFYKKLNKKHPNLTSREVRLCAFLKLKMNTKEIANLTNLSVKTVEDYRTNLRKKLGLPKKINLIQYISKL